MSEIKNNPKVGKEKNYFVMTGTIAYPVNRLTTSVKMKPYVTFLLEQKREAGADYKEYSRYFQVLCFEEGIVDLLTTLSNQVRVEVTGNITIQAKQQGKFRVSLNKLIALDVKITEDLNIPFKSKKSADTANKTEEEQKVFAKPAQPKPSNVPVLETADDDLPF